MTNEQRVKKVHPKARARWSARFKVWEIWPGDLTSDPIGEATHRESWAWGDAARKLKAKEQSR